MIGNSLTYWNGGTNTHVQALAKEAGYTVVIDERTIGGATLGSLWRNSGNRSPRSLIANGDYDVVILQEDMPELTPRNSQGINNFYENAELFIEDIQKVGATPMFYMTWEFQRLNWISQQQISDAHRQMWQKHGINSAPVGDSWSLADKSAPGRWDFFSRDKEHQSWEGTYIAASGIFAQLFAESPVGLKYIPSGSGISSSDAEALQRQAWAATQIWNENHGNIKVDTPYSLGNNTTVAP
jgi:hypothetical protein